MTFLSLFKKTIFQSVAFAALFVVGASTIMPSVAVAHSVKAGMLEIKHPYAKPSLMGIKTAAFYVMTIKNNGDTPEKLVGISSERGSSVELHRMFIDGDVMRMRAVPELIIPAHTEVKLNQKDGYHFMLMGIEKPLQPAEHFKAMFQFEKAGPVAIEIHVDDSKPENSDMARHAHH